MLLVATSAESLLILLFRRESLQRQRLLGWAKMRRMHRSEQGHVSISWCLQQRQSEPRSGRCRGYSVRRALRSVPSERCRTQRPGCARRAACCRAASCTNWRRQTGQCNPSEAPHQERATSQAVERNTVMTKAVLILVRPGDRRRSRASASWRAVLGTCRNIH